jgi:opacity protein-like surface antigen
MKPHRRVCVLGLALAASASALAGAPTASDAVRHVEGKAFANSDGHLMYRESHWLYDDGGNPSRLVLYRCPDGRPFARKLMHDDGNAQAPDFVLDDARTGYQEGVRSAGGKRVVFVRDNKGAQERIAALDTWPMPVIDAGFDAYIRNPWHKLGKDSRDKILFLVPSRLGTLGFSVKRMADAPVNGRDARHYRLSLDNLIGFALPHIDVAYDAKTRDLLSFNGMANIRGSNGDNVKVKITFDASTDKNVGRVDLDAASKVALDGHCDIQ